MEVTGEATMVVRMVGGKVVSILLVLLLLTTPFLSGCVSENNDEKVNVRGEKLSNEQIEAMYTLMEFAVVCDDTTLELIRILSDNFTKPFLSSDLEITDEEYDRIFELEERILSYEDRVMWALGVLENKKGPSLTGVSSTSAVLPLMVMPKASAHPSPGLISKIVDWFYWFKGGGKRFRDKIIDTLETMKKMKEEGKIAYEQWNDEVPQILDHARDLGIEAKNLDDLIEKLKSGNYDTKTYQLNRHFAQTQLYYDIQRDKANGKDPIATAAVQEAAGALEKTAQVGYEGVKSVTFAKAMELPGNLGKKIIELYDKFERFIKWYNDYHLNVLQHGTEKGSYEWVKNRVEDWLGDKAEEYLGKKVGKKSGEFLNAMLYNEYQRLSGYDRYMDLLESTAEKGGKLASRLIVKDLDKETPVKFAIASSDDEEKMTRLLVFYDDNGLDELFLPEGDFELLLSDMDSLLQTIEESVESGKEVVIELDSSVTSTALRTTPTQTKEIYKLTVKASPKEVPIGGEITVYGKIDPPVATTLHITLVNMETGYKNTFPFKKKTNSDGEFMGRYSITIENMEKKIGDCMVIVTAPELGITETAHFRVVKPSLTVDVTPSKVKVGEKFVVSVWVTPIPGKDIEINIGISNSKTGYAKTYRESISGSKGSFEGHYYAAEEMKGKNTITVEIPGTDVKKVVTLVVEAVTPTLETWSGTWSGICRIYYDENNEDFIDVDVGGTWRGTVSGMSAAITYYDEEGEKSGTLKGEWSTTRISLSGIDFMGECTVSATGTIVTSTTVRGYWKSEDCKCGGTWSGNLVR